jgi:hypothetical protein
MIIRRQQMEVFIRVEREKFERRVAAIFGPVDRYLQEDGEGGVLLRFRLTCGALAASKEPLAPEKVRT